MKSLFSVAVALLALMTAVEAKGDTKKRGLEGIYAQYSFAHPQSYAQELNLLGYSKTPYLGNSLINSVNLLPGLYPGASFYGTTGIYDINSLYGTNTLHSVPQRLVVSLQPTQVAAAPNPQSLFQPQPQPPLQPIQQQQRPAAVSPQPGHIGSGSLGYVRLANGLFALGSGSLGYASSSQAQQRQSPSAQLQLNQPPTPPRPVGGFIPTNGPPQPPLTGVVSLQAAQFSQLQPQNYVRYTSTPTNQGQGIPLIAAYPVPGLYHGGQSLGVAEYGGQSFNPTGNILTLTPI